MYWHDVLMSELSRELEEMLSSRWQTVVGDELDIIVRNNYLSLHTASEENCRLCVVSYYL